MKEYYVHYICVLHDYDEERGQKKKISKIKGHYDIAKGKYTY